MKKKIAIVILVLAFALSSLPIMADNLGELRQQYEDAQTAVQETVEVLESTRAMMNQIHQTIMELDERMMNATDDLLSIDQALYTTQEALAQTEEYWAQAQLDLELQHDAVRARLREIQESGSTGLLSVVLQATSLRDFLLRLELVNNIARHDQEMVERLETTEARVAQMQETYARHLSSVEMLLSQQEAYIERLEGLEAEQLAFFEELAADEEKYEALLAFEREQAQIMYTAWSTAYQAERARRTAAQLEQQRIANEQRIAAMQNLGGRFRWPVPSSGRITSGFGYRNHPTRRRREFHTGIDIGARHGADIIAAEGGVVILSSWHGGYGNTVIIDHGGGVHTLYGHNSRNLVSVGDTVTAGQRIALIGSTGVSTGPHLHFEVRVNGQAVNPGPFLGL